MNFDPRSYIKGNYSIMNQKIPKVVAIGGGILLLLIGGYLASTNLDKGFGSATNIELTAPEKARPRDSFTITGSFVDAAGAPIQVEQGYYRVTDAVTGVVKASGSLGQNISEYNTTISTLDYLDNREVNVTVADNPKFL